MIGSNKIISLEEKIKNNLSFEKKLYIKCFSTIVVTNIFVYLLASSTEIKKEVQYIRAIPSGAVQLNIALQSNFLNHTNQIQTISIFDSQKNLLIEKALFIKSTEKKEMEENKNEVTVEVNEKEIGKIINAKDSRFIISPFSKVEKKETKKLIRNKYEIIF